MHFVSSCWHINTKNLFQLNLREQGNLTAYPQWIIASGHKNLKKTQKLSNHIC